MGIYYLFNLQHNIFKEKSILKSEKSLLKTITLSLNEYENNLLDDHEIKLENKLYDIINKKITGNRVEIKVISDEDEKSYNTKYKNQDKKNSSSKNKLILKNKLTTYLSENFTTNSFGFYSFQKNIPINYDHKKLQLISKEVIIPPPKFI